MELEGGALIDHLQFLIAERQSADGLLRFLSGLSPRLWGQIRASALIPEMITACAARPLDLATLVYLCTESPCTMSAVTSACIDSCLSVLGGELCAVESQSTPSQNGQDSQRRRRRKRRLNECESSCQSSSVIRLPDDCQFVHNRPSLLMGHSLSRATYDPNFARMLYQQQKFILLIRKLINSDVENSLRDRYSAFRLFKCLCILENISSLEGAVAVQKCDLMKCLLSWLQQVLLLESSLWIKDDSEHALLQSVCTALRSLTNLTNRDLSTCAALRSANGIKVAIQIIQQCQSIVSESSAACDLVTIAVALLTNCAEVDKATQRLLCNEPCLIDLFQIISPFWHRAIDSSHPDSEQIVHCRTVAGYVSLLLTVIYLGCSDQRAVLARSCSIPTVADILDQFASLTKLGHPEQTQMIDEITRFHQRLVSCITTDSSDSII